jgi:hypothetical protein
MRRHTKARGKRARGVTIAIVVVGYPATPLTSSRLRLTKSDLDEILKACEEIGTVLNIKMSQAVDRDGQLFREKLDDISSLIGGGRIF